MGVKIEICRPRNGAAIRRWIWKRTLDSGKLGNETWILGIVLTVLAEGGAELNSGQRAEQDEIDQILKQTKN
jgi:hypothetical protein